MPPLPEDPLVSETPETTTVLSEAPVEAPAPPPRMKIEAKPAGSVRRSPGVLTVVGILMMMCAALLALASPEAAPLRGVVLSKACEVKADMSFCASLSLAEDSLPVKGSKSPKQRGGKGKGKAAKAKVAKA